MLTKLEELDLATEDFLGMARLLSSNLGVRWPIQSGVA